jgi:hypothetical protein
MLPKGGLYIFDRIAIKLGIVVSNDERDIPAKFHDDRTVGAHGNQKGSTMSLFSSFDRLRMSTCTSAIRESKNEVY